MVAYLFFATEYQILYPKTTNATEPANIPPHIKISEFVQKAKGRSSKRIQEEFPILKKKYWGRHLWGRGYFSSTSGNVTDDMINEYINRHTDAHETDSTSNIRLE